MKIGNSPEAVTSSSVAADRSAAADAGRAKSAPTSTTTAGALAKKAPEASAQIALSSTASKLLSGVPEDGSFDSAKVDRISQAISDGKFNVNADAIADKLIANAQEMLSRPTAH